MKYQSNFLLSKRVHFVSWSVNNLVLGQIIVLEPFVKIHQSILYLCILTKLELTSHHFFRIVVDSKFVEEESDICFWIVPFRDILTPNGIKVGTKVTKDVSLVLRELSMMLTKVVGDDM